MDYAALKLELTTDPLTRNYAGMADSAAKADDLNTAYRQQNRATMPASEVFNAIVKAEFNALAAGDQQMVWDILHMGEVNPFGLEADLFIDMFGGGSSTISALQAARKESISRAQELGFGTVRPGDIEFAEALP